MSDPGARENGPLVLPDQSGRVAVVTGANSGVGYWTALHLARAGAHVVLACRSRPRAEAALAELRAAVPAGSFEILPLDLTDTASVQAAAAGFADRHQRLDLLVNNAGIAMAPLARTVDGTEMHFAANFLGHFALTGLLLDPILATPGSRVVQVGSLAHRFGRIRFDDLHYERRRYRSMSAYGQSKLANLVFMVELERRLREVGAATISVGGHPGAAATGIVDDTWIARIPGVRPTTDWLGGKVLNVPELTAVPSLLAATSPDLPGGSYLGPGGPGNVRGPVGPARLSPRVHDRAAATRLWEVAEKLTEVCYL